MRYPSQHMNGSTAAGVIDGVHRAHLVALSNILLLGEIPLAAKQQQLTRQLHIGTGKDKMHLIAEVLIIIYRISYSLIIF